MKKLIFIALLLYGVQFAFSQAFTIKEFDVTIKVNKSGYIQVNEVISVHFNESRRGIYRDIIFKYTYGEKNYRTPISNIKVKGEDVKISGNGAAKRIRIGNPTKYIRGDKTYDISYTVKGPFITNATYDEFYWNITGNDWEAPIELVKYKIELPDDIQIPTSDLKIYSGTYGSGNTLDSSYIQQGGRIIYGNNSERLNPGEGITISIKLPLGYIDKENVVDLSKSKTQEVVDDVKVQWPWAIIPAVIISLGVGFWSRLRKRYTPDYITEQMAYPPDDMNPAEVGAFYDHIVNDRDVISLLPYWAADGFIRLEHNPNTEDTLLYKLNDLHGTRARYEYTLFNNLFRNRDSVALSELKDKFHSTHSLVKSMIKEEIVDMQLYDPEYRYWFKSWRAWLPVVLFIPLGIIGVVTGYWFAGVFFFLGFLIGLILLLQQEVVSQKGHRIQLHLKSFYNFLKNKEANTMNEVFRSDPNYFDKVYPYAVAFNLDKSFVQKARTYVPTAPRWYGWYGVPIMTGGSRSMEEFGKTFEPKEITTAFKSMPMPESGSIGSGSSGGGFSGGGFGGGGGGSW